MTFPIDLTTFTDSHDVEEAGYNDDVTRELGEAIRHLERANSMLREEGEEGAARQTTLEATVVAHSAVSHRLALLKARYGLDGDLDGGVQIDVE